MTDLTGRDVLNHELAAGERNAFMVAEGLKGVTGRLLDPGTHYLNPYMYNVVEVNTQSQRFEMSGQDVINFLTLDGFSVTVEGTMNSASSGRRQPISPTGSATWTISSKN